MLPAHQADKENKISNHHVWEGKAAIKAEIQWEKERHDWAINCPFKTYSVSPLMVDLWIILVIQLSDYKDSGSAKY